ncbi:MAG: phage portal protein [Deltaproteobacteria bacterium]|nr:phage portal protein [Deltaproteobacteria bacterium]MCL4873851.1 phage portal protein [bacterium]
MSRETETRDGKKPGRFARGLRAFESAIDRAIGVVSPRREVQRRYDRTMALKARQYAAAKVSRTGGDWLPVNQDVNSIIRSSSEIIRGRSRQLVRDFPYFNRAINNLVNYSVGIGIVFQSRVQDEDGKYDKKAIRAIEDAVKWAFEEMHAAGKLHYCELERLAKRQDVESGELLFVKKAIKETGRYIPYALQEYEADWLTTAYAKPADGNELDQGIEFDPNTGRVKAYHFAVPSGYGASITAGTKTQRVPAEYVIHNFQTLRPGQLRGISPFTTAILIAHDLGDYMDAEIDGAKLAAKYLAIVETPDALGFQNARGQLDPNTGKKIEELENAIIEYLRPGEKISFAQHNRPGDKFSPFVKFCLRMVAVATDTTYELLTSDYDTISYSNLRGIRNDFAVMMKPHSMRHIRHVTKPVVEDVITQAVLAGKLDLPGFWKNPRHYFRGTYTPPGMESIDPLREGAAWIEQIKAGIRSPQEVVAGRGRDYEEVLDELAEAKRMAEERGLVWMDTMAALQQNPAALGASVSAGADASEGGGEKKKYAVPKSKKPKDGEDGEGEEDDEDRRLPEDMRAALDPWSEL